MLKKLFVIFALFLTACSWQFKSNELYPEAPNSVHNENYNPYNTQQYREMYRILHNKLPNNITIVPVAK